MKRAFTFIVEGRGEFPFDMLRYDRCFPFSENDSNIMGGRDRRAIRMTHMSYIGPTVGRWESFGWKVHLIEEMD